MEHEPDTVDDAAAASPTTPADETSTEQDKPTFRQLVHWATGDRDAEAKALAAATDGDVSRDTAKIAVEQAHGDIPSDKDPDDSEVARPADVHEVEADKHTTG